MQSKTVRDQFLYLSNWWMPIRLEEMANIPGIFKQRSKRFKICWRGITWICSGSTYKLESKKKNKNQWWPKYYSFFLLLIRLSSEYVLTKTTKTIIFIYLPKSEFPLFEVGKSHTLNIFCNCENQQNPTSKIAHFL